MKSFFSQHGYTCVRLLITQIAISIFGTVLALATTTVGNDAFTICVSVFAVLFFVFLIYNVMWEVGAKDRLSVDLGKKKKNLSAWSLVHFCSYSPSGSGFLKWHILSLQLAQRRAALLP